jgi:hypothetical protein
MMTVGYGTTSRGSLSLRASTRSFLLPAFSSAFDLKAQSEIFRASACVPHGIVEQSAVYDM